MPLLLKFCSWEQGFFQSFSTLRKRQKQNQLLHFFYCRVKLAALFPAQGNKLVNSFNLATVIIIISNLRKYLINQYYIIYTNYDKP